MGGHSVRIKGALYSFKSDLEEMARDGAAPRWVGTPHHTVSGPNTSLTERTPRDEYVRGMRKHAQEWGEPQVANFTLDFDTIPPRIATKCREWLDENKAAHEDYYGDGTPRTRFRTCTLDICFGPRGGVRDVGIYAVFKN
jgi:hypothetical protein